MSSTDAAWLARTVEDALDPALPIVDPHHHLWDHAGTWGRYRLPDLRGDSGAGHHVVATVFVECGWAYDKAAAPDHRYVGETRAVADEADRSADGSGAAIRAIVSRADLGTGAAVQAVLDEHVDAGRGLFRGIRHATAFDDDPAVGVSHTKPGPGLMRTPSFVEGARRLAASGLSFDAWLYHPQIPELTALARAVPDLTIVLDHLGGILGIGAYAGRRDEVLAAWRASVAELAACPNVVVKLGGIGMPAYGMRYHEQDRPPSSEQLAADWRGPILHLVEAFGPQRCMFESNFPVDRESVPYVVLWNAFKRIAAGASDDERRLLFHDTAASVYRI